MTTPLFKLEIEFSVSEKTQCFLTKLLICEGNTSNAKENNNQLKEISSDYEDNAKEDFGGKKENKGKKGKVVSREELEKEVEDAISEDSEDISEDDDAANAQEDEDDYSEEVYDEEAPPSKKSGNKGKAVRGKKQIEDAISESVSESEEDYNEDDTEVEESESPPPKAPSKIPAKKGRPASGKSGAGTAGTGAVTVTSDDVTDACKARAGRSNRVEVSGILKRFGVKSVTELEPSQYPAVIKAMNNMKVV